jgi:hypothetical protein
MKKHPDAAELALSASGDLAPLARLAVYWHNLRCPACRAETAAYAEARLRLRTAASAGPRDLDLESLEAEMTANIRLGLEAGRLAGPVPPAPAPVFAATPRYAFAVVALSLLFVFAAGSWLGRPAGAPAAPGYLLEAGPDGLAVSGRGAGITLLSPSAQPVSTTVSWDGGASARYIDADSGQVTLHHVYAQ